MNETKCPNCGWSKTYEIDKSNSYNLLIEVSNENERLAQQLQAYKDKLEAGMYVRTIGDAYEPSKIGKIKEVDVASFKEVCYRIDSCGKHILIPKSFITKSSFNIIDLIEVGDYVNGSCIIDIKSKYEIGKGLKAMVGKYLHGLNKPYFYIREQDIESIVTKEQFKLMGYVVKE